MLANWKSNVSHSLFSHFAQMKRDWSKRKSGFERAEWELCQDVFLYVWFYYFFFLSYRKLLVKKALSMY